MVWDEERIKALCERWGVAWRERGSMKRPVKIDFAKGSAGHDKLRRNGIRWSLREGRDGNVSGFKFQASNGASSA